MPNPIQYNQLFDIDGLNAAIQQAEGTANEFGDTASQAFKVVAGNAALLRAELEKINATINGGSIKLTDDAGQAAVVEYAKQVTNLTNQIKAQQAQIDGLTKAMTDNAAAINEAKLKAAEFTKATKEQQLVTETNRTEIVKTTLAMKELALQNLQNKAAVQASIGPYKELSAQLTAQRNAAKDIGASKGINSDEFKAAAANVQVLDGKLKEIDQAVGQSQRNVGNYGNAFERALGRVTNLGVIGGRVVTQLSRQIISLGVGFLSLEIGAKAIEGLYKYVAALNIFNPIATESERIAKGLSEALNGSDYQKGIASIEELGANFDLIKKGIGDSDTVINKYNETIGKTFGYVNNLNDAQQGFIDHKDAYIQAIIQEAEVQAIANDAAKEYAELAEKNAKLRDDQQKNAALEAAHPGFKTYDAANINKGINTSIAENEARMKLVISNAQKALEAVQSQPIPGVTGQKTGSDAVGELNNKISNQTLETRKITDQAIIDNDKNSYTQRLNAAKDFAEAEREINANNEALQLKELPKNDARKADIIKESNNKLLQINEASAKQIRDLEDKRDAQDLQHLKNNLEKQIATAKAVLDNPGSSLDAKQAALENYNGATKSLNTAVFNSETSSAGNNSQAAQLAKDNFAKADLERTKFYADEGNKILKDAYDEQIALAKKASDSFLAYVDQHVNVLKQASDARQNQIEQDAADAIQGLATQRLQGKIDEEDYQNQLRDIDNQSNKDKLDDEIKTATEIVKIRQALVTANINAPTDVKKQLDSSLADAEKVLAQLNLALKKLGIKTTNETTQENLKNTADVQGFVNKGAQIAGQANNNSGLANLLSDGSNDLISGIPQKDAIEQSSKLAMDATSAYTDFVINQSKIRQEALENEMSYEVQGAGNNSEAKQRIEEEYTKLILAEKQKQAKAAKAEAALEVILNTAVAATKVTAQTGIFGLATIPIILALGAAELALVLSSPIPQFAGGREGGDATFAEVNERGPEALVKNGRVRFANAGRRGLTYLQQGEKVITADRTSEMINNQIINADKVSQTRLMNDQYISTMSHHNNMDYDKMGAAVANAVSGLPLEQNNWDDKGYQRSTRIKNTRILAVRDRNRL